MCMLHALFDFIYDYAENVTTVIFSYFVSLLFSKLLSNSQSTIIIPLFSLYSTTSGADIANQPCVYRQAIPGPGFITANT